MDATGSPVTYDTVVIGAGLAGLTAALRLTEAGQRVLVVAKGVGATHLAPATIDVLGYVHGPVESPARALPAFVAENAQHPYRNVPIEQLRASLDWFKARLGDHGYRGDLEENILLPTAVGVAKPTALVPETMAAGDLRAGGRFVFVGFRGLKDFHPAYLAENLARASLPTGTSVAARALELVPPVDGPGDVSTVELARRFEQGGFRESVLGELARRLVPGEVVGFPAVLGLAHAREVRHELEASLGHRVFEVPTLPPSVQGIRLYESMTAAVRRAGGRLVIGSAVTGAASRGERIDSVAAQTAARPLTYRAHSFLLATGGFASGGILLDSSREAREAVFGLPLACVPAREQARFEPGYFDHHALSRVGVGVDERFRPVDAEGVPAYENLYAAGATIAGAVPWQEASGNGVSLATGYAAATAILESAP